MIKLFARAQPAEAPTLGTSMLAQPVKAGASVPDGCVGLAFDQAGQTRRFHAGSRIDLAAHERALCFHPGPYSVDLMPFLAAPELGLRLTFAADDPDPRLGQQRFDLFLASEASEGIALTALCQQLDATLQRELAQGNLELPPCTSPDEWDAFRAGLNQLLYTRFGVSVADCLPVDLGDSVDYAQLLLARVQAPAQTQRATPSGLPAPDDAFCLRRLFLELPCVTSALRLLALPPGQARFSQHQGLLQRLVQLNLSVATMPSLELAAPGVPLAPAQRAARAAHSAAALGALEEAWALLARLTLAAPVSLDGAFDEADRILANLELHCAARRATP